MSLIDRVMGTDNEQPIKRRKRKFTETNVEKILVLVRAGCTRHDAAKIVGLSPTSIGNWIKRSEKFSREMEKAEAECRQFHVAKITKDSHWQSSAFLLQVKDPATYRKPKEGRFSEVDVVAIVTQISGICRRYLPEDQVVPFLTEVAALSHNALGTAPLLPPPHQEPVLHEKLPPTEDTYFHEKETQETISATASGPDRLLDGDGPQCESTSGTPQNPKEERQEPELDVARSGRIISAPTTGWYGDDNRMMSKQDILDRQARQGIPSRRR